MDFYDPFSTPLTRRVPPRYKSRTQYPNNPYFQRSQPQYYGDNPFFVNNYSPEPECYNGEVDDYTNPIESYDSLDHTATCVPQPRQQLKRNNIKNTKRSVPPSSCNINRQKPQPIKTEPKEKEQEQEPPSPAKEQIPQVHHKVEQKVNPPIRIPINESTKEKLEKQQNQAATRIQRWYAGASVRKLDIISKLKKLTTIKRQIDQLSNEYNPKVFNTTPQRKDISIFEELLIQKMLNLDGVTSQNNLVRERRKELTRHINKLLDQIETIKSKQKENLPKVVQSAESDVKNVDTQPTTEENQENNSDTKL